MHYLTAQHRPKSILLQRKCIRHACPGPIADTQRPGCEKSAILRARDQVVSQEMLTLLRRASEFQCLRLEGTMPTDKGCLEANTHQ